MSYKQPDLQVTYEPSKGWAHFVLYTEPQHGLTSAGLNGTVSIERQTRYVKEWLGRLQRCDPNPLHTTLVGNSDIPALFHPCVYDDKDSPSAVGGDGCVCYQTSYDPEFGLPVVAHHYRTVTGNIEKWTYSTYAPVDLRPNDTFASLIIDQGAYFWVRTASGLLSLLPESRKAGGYSIGYGGGGPTNLAWYIQQLIESNGGNTAAGALRGTGMPDARLREWVSSEESMQTRELTLDDLRRIQRG
ncbi:hypothetical protein [Streptomyces sp. NRRL WC-3742]|uniref:hypothetical protein n=1 Tax=Streptomyces sp. NRRL WC-3742 TaxID=1463934 RepID=UPI0004CB5106|nr:hypothetical protein [Streptomyces sp. NRRL WC-3742]